MPHTNTPFAILLIESDDEAASIIGRTAERTFPEAVLYRTSTLEEAIQHLASSPVAPRLILLASYRRNSSGSGQELPAFTGHPLVRLRPVLLLEHNDNTAQVSQYYHQGIAAYHTKPETYSGWKVLLEAIRGFWFAQARLLPE